MIWIIIVAVLALVIGPAMYLKPSPKDKRLVALRGRARELGLTVSIEFLPKLNPTADERVSSGGVVREPKVERAAYRLAHGADELLGDVDVLVLKIPEDVSVVIPERRGDWAILKGELPKIIDDKLAELLRTLPETVLGLAFDARCVTCYWSEPAGSEATDVEAIAAWLNRAVTQIRT